MFVIAKRDTNIINMHNLDDDKDVPKGTRMFRIVSEPYTKYLDSNEICVYNLDYKQVHFTHKDDWEPYDSL